MLTSPLSRLGVVLSAHPTPHICGSGIGVSLSPRPRVSHRQSSISGQRPLSGSSRLPLVQRLTTGPARRAPPDVTPLSTGNLTGFCLSRGFAADSRLGGGSSTPPRRLTSSGLGEIRRTRRSSRPIGHVGWPRPLTFTFWGRSSVYPVPAPIDSAQWTLGSGRLEVECTRGLISYLFCKFSEKPLLKGLEGSLGPWLRFGVRGPVTDLEVAKSFGLWESKVLSQLFREADAVRLKHVARGTTPARLPPVDQLVVKTWCEVCVCKNEHRG
ncbi:hypothetical protein NDU88_003907 [Pleurodeles waltl]|uniref:Uncharacterized protein n=1 Tax=Pleurodeles waltl TaxID=8319 RepID=A0AAV7QEL1_PLEWA|nr:hypothetical protein NDU88_003907 [Pleurodeles waltl]